MDGVQRYICNQQKTFFGWAASNGYDMYVFIPVFLRSSFCNRSLDKPYSVDQFADVMDWVDFMEADGEFGPAKVSEPFPKHVAEWLGFVYRQLQIETGLPSRTLVSMIPPDRLTVAYAGLHTVDEDMQAEIICRDFGLSARI